MGADPQLLELLGPLETLPAGAGPRLEVLLVAVTGVAAGVDQVNLQTLRQLPYFFTARTKAEKREEKHLSCIVCRSESRYL